MKRSLRICLTLLLMALPAPLYAQVTYRDSPVTPGDLKPNDPAVPDAYAITGQFERIVVMRLKHQTDLQQGMQKLAKQENIQHGVILAGLGSLRGYHTHMVNSRDFPTRNVYIKEAETPVDLVSVNGYIVNGVVHAHMTIGTGQKTIAGHVEADGNEVYTFAIITVGVLKGADLSRVDDKFHR